MWDTDSPLELQPLPGLSHKPTSGIRYEIPFQGLGGHQSAGRPDFRKARRHRQKGQKSLLAGTFWVPHIMLCFGGVLSLGNTPMSKQDTVVPGLRVHLHQQGFI